MTYVSGWVCAVPNANREQYRQMSQGMAKLFKAHGALRYVEGWGDDVPDGQTTSFGKAVDCQPDETVCFSWMEWPSREARDTGMQKAMASGKGPDGSDKMPFDGKRLIFGGFEAIVDE